MSFTVDPFVVEAAFGADINTPASTWTWEKISGPFTDSHERLVDQTVSITRGRSDGASQVEPTTCTLLLDNKDGALTPGKPGPWYPYVTRGTPLRCWVHGTTHLLASGGLSTEDGASTADVVVPSGDLWLAVDVETSGRGYDVYAGQWDQPGVDHSVLFYGDQGDLVYWQWSTNGADNHAIPFPDLQLGRYRKLGVHFQPDNGAGGHTARLYTCTEWGDWELIRETTLAGTTTVHVGAAPFVLGNAQAVTGAGSAGRVYRAELRSGDMTGTLLASPDITAQEPGATSFDDDQGNTWTTVNATITDRDIRFAGQIAEIAPSWPYGDISRPGDPGESMVSITAAGPLRRLQQGSKAITSGLARSIPLSGPVAYWPLEDNQGSTFAAPLVGAVNAQVAGLTFGSDDSLPGSRDLPLVAGTPMVAAPVFDGTEGAWTFAFVYHGDGPPDADEAYRVVAEWASQATFGYIYTWTIELMLGAARVRAVSSGGGFLTIDQEIAIGDDVWDGWNWLIFTDTPAGSVTQWAITWWNIGGEVGLYTQPEGITGAGRVTSVKRIGIPGWSVGHLVVFDREIPPEDFPSTFHADGLAGETAAARIEACAAALASDLTVQGITRNGNDITTRLGAQQNSQLLDVMRDAAATDGGILGEQVDGLGFHYRSRWSLYDQPALVLSARPAGRVGEIVNPFEPVADDQQYRNDVTVSRQGGASARAVDPSAMTGNVYDTSVTLNLETDDVLADEASWLLHVMSWPGMRYPSVTIDLSFLTVAQRERVKRLATGDRVQITDLPPQHPEDTVDLIWEGGTESITPDTWTVTGNCSPAGPWTVGLYLDDILGRYDSGSSELDADITDTDTSLTVSTPGYPWSDDDLPFDLRLGGEGADVVNGETVTVTAITGASSPQTFTVTRAATSYPWAAGTQVRLAHPAVLAL